MRNILITALRNVMECIAEDYKGEHQAPDKDDDPMHNLENTFGEDMYGPNAAKYYHMGDRGPRVYEAINIIQKAKDKPDTKVKIYRAVPKIQTRQERIDEIEKEKAYILKRGKVPSYVDTDKDSSGYYDEISEEQEKLEAMPAEEKQPEKLKINKGDWVTITKSYAVEHGRSNLNNNYKILTKTVKAKDLYTDGNSIQEWGYNP